MTLKPGPPTIQDARAIADGIVQSFSSIDAVILFGSVARGDADEGSDIDLVVIGSENDLTPEHLRAPLSAWSDRVSLLYFPTSEFQRLYRERALFIAHLKKEGVVLYNRLDLLHTILSQPFSPVVNVGKEIKAHRAKLAPYLDPRPFNNNFLFCLSHLYSIGKGVVMLGLAKKGVLEFNREAAFLRFASLNPDLARETEEVAKLRPFYRLVTGRAPEPLPFPYRLADREMTEAVKAIQTLAERVEAL